ncbi:hypothetical protein D9Q98_005442 [Chlorella vulgaris]|uniref:Crossover junction endonuclease MUS81-like HHH domain-containing protein n=1 Tax=Chlorella vulgaris TaxID=3077 RepID=A0A9D4TM90_CHLVU|nr:hypothetical protein D9Q98_005442 [Chlorella vulgaris]
MAPKRKAKPPPSDDDTGSDYEESLGAPSDESDSDYEAEDEPTPKKKAPPRRAAAKKKKAASSSDEEDDEEGGSPAPRRVTTSRPVRSAAAKKKASSPPEEVTQLPDGWTLHPPSFMYKIDPLAQGGKKIAAFDLDGTLAVVKSGRQFPMGPDDWRWFNKGVPAKLRELHSDGYQIVIFSNQGGVKKAINGKASSNVREKVDLMIEDLNSKKKKKDVDVPVQVFMATMKDHYRKPATGMWEFFVQHANAHVQPDLSESFYCGDAAGRDGDINEGAASDREFAEAIGVRFLTPEEQFGETDVKKVADTGESSGHNDAMADAFARLADMLAGEGERFKATAFRNVSKIIAAHPAPITAAKDLKGVKGVGASSQAKITEFLETGTLAALQEAGIEVGAAAPVDANAEIGLRLL